MIIEHAGLISYRSHISVQWQPLMKSRNHLTSNASNQYCIYAISLYPSLSQDPVNPSGTVIVIRSLVPGGVAQQDGRLVPGDRLVFVNDVSVEHATLDQAVQALKGAARGTVRIGVAKPLPLAQAFRQDGQVRQSAGERLKDTDGGRFRAG